MAGPDHHDHAAAHDDTDPVKLAIGIAIGTAALIVAIILLTQLAESFYGQRSLKDVPAMSEANVKARIAPVAKVVVDPNAPAPAAPAAAAPAAGAPAAVPNIPPPAAKTADAGAAGKATYDSACSACHNAGVAGAPKLGDKAAWAPRLKEGKDHLYAAAIKGKGAMPPKGGNLSLSDDAVKAAVDYMLASVR